MRFLKLLAGFLAAGLILALSLGGTPAGATAAEAAVSVSKTFAPFNDVKTHADDKNFYVESNGMPDHTLMVGITAWQQQVPLPQAYTGDNAWSFPLFPVPASQPLSAKTHFFRGAIAIAADGVPIFNPIKNDGKTDTYLAGELDTFGGHSGKADDYHYHIVPLSLQEKLPASVPLAWALDGYPIYGLAETDGSAVSGLDAFNGHSTAVGYHYHVTKTYPYLNGGFHGKVTEADGQVDPQPRAQPVRPDTQPLDGAKITAFTKGAAGDYTLAYQVNGKEGKVHYTILASGALQFDYTDTAGRTTSQTYSLPPAGGPGPAPGPGGPRPRP